MTKGETKNSTKRG